MGKPERNDVRRLLAEQGVFFQELPSDEADSLLIEWREQFETEWSELTPAMLLGGKYWRLLKEHVRVVSGHKARELYSEAFERQSPELIVLLVHKRVRALRCSSERLPDPSGCECLVFPPDLSWTMGFSHEDDAMGGPDFVRAEWIPQRIPWQPED